MEQETEQTAPIYTWKPEYDQIVDAYVQTKWKETVYLSIEREQSEDSENSGSTSDSDPLPVVVHYEWEWLGDVLEGVNITSDENGVYLDAYDVSADIFPASDIEYQVYGGDEPPYRTTQHTNNFRNVPDDVAEMVRYIPNPSRTKTFTLSVTAYISKSGEKIKLSDTLDDYVLSNLSKMTACFSIVIWTDYSIGKQSLQEKVNASYRAKR